MFHRPRHRDDSASDSARRALLGSALVTPLGISLVAVAAGQAGAQGTSTAAGDLTLVGGTGSDAAPSGTSAVAADDADTLDAEGTTIAVENASATISLSHQEKVALLRRKLMRDAASWYGVRYRYGGTTRHGVDCSGLTHAVYHSVGLKLPRTASEQHAHTHSVRKRRRGDLVFFHNASGHVFHVGVYAGHGHMIDAPHTGSHVRRRKIWHQHGVHITYGRHPKMV